MLKHILGNLEQYTEQNSCTHGDYILRCTPELGDTAGRSFLLWPRAAGAARPWPLPLTLTEVWTGLYSTASVCLSPVPAWLPPPPSTLPPRGPVGPGEVGNTCSLSLSLSLFPLSLSVPHALCLFPSLSNIYGLFPYQFRIFSFPRWQIIFTVRKLFQATRPGDSSSFCTLTLPSKHCKIQNWRKQFRIRW